MQFKLAPPKGAKPAAQPAWRGSGGGPPQGLASKSMGARNSVHINVEEDSGLEPSPPSPNEAAGSGLRGRRLHANLSMGRANLSTSRKGESLSGFTLQGHNSRAAGGSDSGVVPGGGERAAAAAEAVRSYGMSGSKSTGRVLTQQRSRSHPADSGMGQVAKAAGGSLPSSSPADSASRVMRSRSISVTGPGPGAHDSGTLAGGSALVGHAVRQVASPGVAGSEQTAAAAAAAAAAAPGPAVTSPSSSQVTKLPPLTPAAQPLQQQQAQHAVPSPPATANGRPSSRQQGGRGAGAGAGGGRGRGRGGATTTTPRGVVTVGAAGRGGKR